MSCSSTDAALNWLLSLAATCTSSPLGPSSPAENNDYLTDWLQISPTLPPPPLQDVTSSSRVNLSQEHSSGYLNYHYGLSATFDSAPPSSQPASQEGSSSDLPFPSSILPAIFNQHNRMLSIDSTASTLLNTPSPLPLAFFSPTGVANLQSHPHIVSPSHDHTQSPSMFSSPASKLIQDLQKSPFGDYYYDTSSGSQLPLANMSDVSPVVRADKLQEYLMNEDRPASKPKKRKKKKQRPREIRSSFVDQLRSAPSLALQPPASSLPTLPGTFPADSSTSPVLLSPVKLTVPSAWNDPETPLKVNSPAPSLIPHDISTSHELPAQTLTVPAFAAPDPPCDMEPLSPLTPLSSLADRSSPQPFMPPANSTLSRKRPNTDSSTPVRRSKRPRRNVILQSSPVTPDVSPPPSPLVDQPPSEDQDLRPVFSNRVLPSNLETSPKFPLFYRRFPASSYYQPFALESPCELFQVAHPGGTSNPPRDIFDLYTPRFVRGKGTDKVGLCPICVEPVNRGGENKRLWLAMKFSAFKCYHMQYAHGISASTGKPFSPPVSFQIVPRTNPGKKERANIQQGKCHKCSKWVAVEGVKDMESKVPELYWWKHAAACHHDSTLPGEGDHFEHDEVYNTLVKLKESED